MWVCVARLKIETYIEMVPITLVIRFRSVMSIQAFIVAEVE